MWQPRGCLDCNWLGYRFTAILNRTTPRIPTDEKNSKAKVTKAFLDRDPFPRPGCSMKYWISRYLCCSYHLLSLFCGSPFAVWPELTLKAPPSRKGWSRFKCCICEASTLPGWLTTLKKAILKTTLKEFKACCLPQPVCDGRRQTERWDAHRSPSWMVTAPRPLLTRPHDRTCGARVQFFALLLRSQSSSSLKPHSHKEEELRVEADSLWLSVTRDSQGLS